MSLLSRPRSNLSDSPPITIIQPPSGWVSLGLRELWEYRDLFYFLVWKDVKTRYAQSVLGIGWAVIQPVFSMIVFTVIFGRLVNVDSDGVPYPIFSYAALVPWTFFAYGLQQSSNSLVGSSNLLKKIYFPRLVIPISAVISGAVDFVHGLLKFHQHWRKSCKQEMI